MFRESELNQVNTTLGSPIPRKAYDAQPTRERDLWDELREAQSIYAKLCYEVEQTTLQREQAYRNLCDLSGKANAVIAKAMEDPTATKEAVQCGQMKPGNGRY